LIGRQDPCCCVSLFSFSVYIFLISLFVDNSHFVLLGKVFLLYRVMLQWKLGAINTHQPHCTKHLTRSQYCEQKWYQCSCFKSKRQLVFYEINHVRHSSRTSPAPIAAKASSSHHITYSCYLRAHRNQIKSQVCYKLAIMDPSSNAHFVHTRGAETHIRAAAVHFLSSKLSSLVDPVSWSSRRQ
jgi:hypothetical protein